MCGVNGFTWPDPEGIARMNVALRRRGPDDQGTRVDDRVSLGHVRLSIIDLSPLGRQPMANEDETLWLVFNGEIYNFPELRQELLARGHRFRSRTDSEVLLHGYEQWGDALPNRCNGMWAYCLYDTRRGRLLLSRDQFGVKPLYYWQGERGLAFSSMIAGLRALGLETRPDHAAVMKLLAHNLTQHEAATCFEGVRQLEPGRNLAFDLGSGRLEQRRWYFLQPRPLAEPPSQTAELRERVVKAIELRTIADVDVCCCLSGGMDSSAITCVLDKVLDYRVKTFSFVAPGSGVDESPHIRAVLEHARAEPFFTSMDERSFLDEHMDMVAALEEPATSLSVYAQYKVMQLVASQGLKVVLDGQGGDEIFAGYEYYFPYFFNQLLKDWRLPTLGREAFKYWMNFRKPYPFAMLGFLRLPGRAQEALWRRKIAPWLNHDFLREVLPDDAQRRDPRWRPMSLSQVLELTLFSTSIPHNVLWEDKLAMHFSIENRVPLLDHTLAESALFLPPERLLKDGRTKTILKEALEGVIPESIRLRADKVGFAAPTDELLRQPRAAAYLRDVFDSASFKSRPWWRWREASSILDSHLSGRANRGDLLWKLAHTELWARGAFG